MKILGLYVDPKILEFAMENDLVMFGLEASKYNCHGLNVFARGIEITILEKQAEIINEYTENSLKQTNQTHEP